MVYLCEYIYIYICMCVCEIIKIGQSFHKMYSNNILTISNACTKKVWKLIQCTTYIYIYIYIFTNLISTSIHGTRKNKKNPGQEQEIKISRITTQGKKKKVFWVKKKEKANLVRLLEKNQGVRSQWSKENQKTLCECCNATVIKVLNTIQWSQL